MPRDARRICRTVVATYVPGSSRCRWRRAILFCQGFLDDPLGTSQSVGPWSCRYGITKVAFGVFPSRRWHTVHLRGSIPPLGADPGPMPRFPLPIVPYSKNLEKNARKFVVRRFSLREKSFAFGVSAKSEDLSLLGRDDGGVPGLTMASSKCFGFGLSGLGPRDSLQTTILVTAGFADILACGFCSSPKGAFLERGRRSRKQSLFP
uniref:Uncharacterized protein n=1 Tax=Candidatus Kentrum sp. LFY TaxID=2126342 RepID=A0A450WZ05_9GAMM|nr:MAG: hypothetical protein BECKLFY1418C_GA0070996_11135 [Candidatus Kentron sp. LFY]